MRAVRMMTVVVVGFAGLLLSTGCTDPQALQIAGLQRDNIALQKENAQLKNQINDLIVRLKRTERDLAAALEAARNQPISDLPEGWKGKDGIAWIDLSEDILFDSGKSSLSSQGQAELRKVVGQIKGNPDLADRGIWVIGHTDSDPIKLTKDKWIDNLDLSVNRGAAVTREFYKLGLDPKNVVAAGQGEHNPKAPNDSKANKRINRRVQVMAVARPPTSDGREERTEATPDGGRRLMPEDKTKTAGDMKPDAVE